MAATTYRSRSSHHLLCNNDKRAVVGYDMVKEIRYVLIYVPLNEHTCTVLPLSTGPLLSLQIRDRVNTKPQSI